LAGGVGSYREDRVGGDGGPGCAGLAAWLASIEHLGSVHDERELESLKAAARQRVAAGHVFTQPWPAGPSRPGPDILGSCFVLRVEAKIPHRSEGMGIDARATRGRRSQDQAAG
jgi:hypothetical protein